MHPVVRSKQKEVTSAKRKVEGFRVELCFIAFVWVFVLLLEAASITTGIMINDGFFVLHVITLPGMLGVGFWTADAIDRRIEAKHALEDANDELMEAYEDYGV